VVVGCYINEYEVVGNICISPFIPIIIISNCFMQYYAGFKLVLHV